MKDITHLLTDMYEPVHGLIFFGNHTKQDGELYVEACDYDRQGRPINLRPLSASDCDKIAGCLQQSTQKNGSRLLSKLFPPTVLYADPLGTQTVIWYTPPQKRHLFFAKYLEINGGIAFTPSLLWKATANDLYIFALKTKNRPTDKSMLYHAPFFNVYEDGRVCLGTVDKRSKNWNCLEEFMQTWEDRFFNSYFTNLLHPKAASRINIVELWQKQISTTKKFPPTVLVKTGKTIQTLIP